MGCAKFSAELIAAFPDAMTETAEWDDSAPQTKHIPSDLPHPPKHWCRVDARLHQYLKAGGARLHVHGKVEHLHGGKPAHGCMKEKAVAPALAHGGVRATDPHLN